MTTISAKKITTENVYLSRLKATQKSDREIHYCAKITTPITHCLCGKSLFAAGRSFKFEGIYSIHEIILEEAKNQALTSCLKCLQIVFAVADDLTSMGVEKGIE